MGAELRARAHFGWHMVQEAAVTELKPLCAGWFAPSQAKPKRVISAPVAAASVAPETRVWQLTAELNAERARSDDLRVQLEASQRDLTRALRRTQGEADTEGTAELNTERARSDEMRIQLEASQRELTRALRRVQGETDTEGTAELRAERARLDQLRIQLETLQCEHTRALRRVQGETDTEGIDELNAERARSDQLRIQLETLQCEHTRALRREASAQGEADTEGQWAALQVLQLRAGTQR